MSRPSTLSKLWYVLFDNVTIDLMVVHVAVPHDLLFVLG